jgi:hypothetical protein
MLSIKSWPFVPFLYHHIRFLSSLVVIISVQEEPTADRNTYLYTFITFNRFIRIILGQARSQPYLSMLINVTHLCHGLRSVSSFVKVLPNAAV